MDLPRFLQIEPVGQCNLRCRMCPIQFRHGGENPKPPAFMAFDVFRRLLDEFDRLEELHLQGMGEPMMHPRFFDMVRYAAARGIRVSTNTNLTLISERRAAECAESGLADLFASLDGASAAVYESIRLRARFERVKRNLGRLVEAKGRAEASPLKIRLVAVAMRENLHELPDLVSLAARFGVDSLSVQHLCHDFSESTLPAHYHPMRDFVDRQTLLNEDLPRIEHYFALARERAAALGIALRLPSPRARKHDAAAPGRTRCDWPWRGAYVAYTGEAMPCCMVATPDRVQFGNMAKEGAAAVWNNAAYGEFRRALDGGSPPEVCRGCSV